MMPILTLGSFPCRRLLLPLAASPLHLITSEQMSDVTAANMATAPCLPHINHMPAGQTAGSGLQLHMPALRKSSS